MFRKQVFILFLILISFTAVSVNAAPTYFIRGSFNDSITGKGIAYVTITVQNATQVVKRQAGDANGRFEIALDTPGTYTVVFHSVGYTTRVLTVELNENNTKAELGEITTAPSVEKIGEVTVAAARPLVRVDTDKIIYSIEADPESKTNSALEMLRKVPLVTVDGEDNVQLRGNSNFRFLLNGKNSAMLSQNPKDFLRSLPANTIRDIEVITNPSSKYEAEGVGGIINIITTRRQSNGFMGRVNSGFDSRGGYNAGVYASTKINRFGFSVNYGHNNFRQPRNLSQSWRENLLSETNRYTDTDGSMKMEGKMNFIMSEASYEIDSLNLLSFSMMGHLGKFNGYGSIMNSDFDLNRNKTREFRNIIDMTNGWGAVSGNIDYQKTFNKPDKTLTISYKLDHSPRSTENINQIDGLLNYMSYRQKSSNDAYGNEHTFQVDYFNPVNKTHQVETGLKYILRQNVSQSDVFRYSDGIWEQDLTRTDDLDYDQHIIGLYAGYLLKVKTFSMKTGLRMEGTVNDGSFTSVRDTTFTNRMFNLIPYITLSKNLDKGQNVRASYTQRLSRPGISYLNPFYNDVDPLNVRFGNPELDAEVSHSFEMSYGKFSPKYNINISLNSSFTNNTIESLSTIQPDGVRITTYENIGKNQRYGANGFGSLRLGTKFNLNTNLGVTYVMLESNDNRNLSNSGFIYNGTMNIRYMPWKNGSFSVFGGLFSSGIMLQGNSSTMYFNSMSYSQEFLEKKLSVSASVTDPFRRRLKYEMIMEDPTFNQTSVNYIYNRMLRLNISYRFGNMQGEIKKARRGIRNEDLKSGGDSNTGGTSVGTPSTGTVQP